MAIKFMKFPEIEDGKERSALEFAWLERQQSEEQKKNQQNYINYGALPEDIVKPAVLWVHYQGLSVLPKSRHVYFQTITAENDEGEVEVVALQPKVQYAGEIYLAVHGENARYRGVELLLDGNRIGAEDTSGVPFGLDSVLSIRVIDLANEKRLLTRTIRECLQHGLEYSPTLSKFKGDLQKFWEGFEKFQKNKDQSVFNPWFVDPVSMSAKTLWRKIDNQDKITSFSEDYLEERRETAMEAQMLPGVSFDMTTGEVFAVAETMSLPEGESAIYKDEISQFVDDDDNVEI